MPASAQEGKYSMFLQDGRGIGRYARTGFGFNNNELYGRFVCSLDYDTDAHCMRISCTTKNSGEAYLRFDSSTQTFGMGLKSEITDAKYCDVQFYELK